MFTNCSLGHCHIIIAVVLWSICVDSRKIRGISLSYKRFYRERKSFLCIDGSKMIPFDQVNDDYCDCVDGSDEPGTAACPNGRFYCTNLGYRSHYIPSSRVNDGICDCCDASDEYRSQTPCQNTCRNLGQRERAEVEGQMRVLGEGLRLKQQLIEEGVLTWREKQAQLRDLQRVSDDLQTQLDDLRKEEARRKEEADALREREIGARETADNSPTSHYRPESPISVFKELDSNRDGSITVDEVQAKLSPVQDEEHALSEDEAVALLGGAHRVDFSRFEETLWTSLRTGDNVTIKGRHGVPGSLADEDPNIKAAVSAAEKAAADLKRVEDAYETVYMEIRYIYELCPFSQVTQKSASGEVVSLGKWGSWAGSPENQYFQMRYESGEPCWQGPTRNTMVMLICGTETALRSVKEPSKCQYVMELQTPVSCQPALRQRGIHSEL
ncbi:glucosidase 2 subunit beta-like isoform X4 [Salvelinus fontinalis]|uniref:glucosidase 2 subunit beta-like isoform X4 n=1 Tax=Salvelinus fontinalis TaxID=8038 RepID=UPI0024857FB8|nr:glucosidase 2 subunit beta-like isoform X4 [Salvelinus fontinalis]